MHHSMISWVVPSPVICASLVAGLTRRRRCNLAWSPGSFQTRTSVLLRSRSRPRSPKVHERSWSELRPRCSSASVLMPPHRPSTYRPATDRSLFQADLGVGRCSSIPTLCRVIHVRETSDTSVWHPGSGDHGAHWRPFLWVLCKRRQIRAVCWYAGRDPERASGGVALLLAIEGSSSVARCACSCPDRCSSWAAH